MSFGINRDAVFAFGGGGVITGIVVAVLLGGSPAAHEPQTPVQINESSTLGEASAKAGADGSKGHALQPLVDALAKAHKALHGDRAANTSGDGLSDDFRGIILENKSYLEILMAFHRTVGPGTLVKDGRLTDAGKALLARAVQIEDDGLSSKNYPVAELKAALAALPKSPGHKEMTVPREAGAAGPVMVRLLKASAFDGPKALEHLEKAGGTPTVAHVMEVADSIRNLPKSATASDDAYRLESGLARMLMFMVLDYRVFRRSGPFVVTRKSEPFALYKKRPRFARKLMVSIVESADPAQALSQLEPPFAEYGKMKAAYMQYRKMAAEGCHTVLPGTWRLQQGKTGPEVVQLQKRLACEGYYKGPIHGQFDDAVKAAVINYQKHHSLNAKGYVKKSTLRSMNISLDRRAKQLALVLQRMRESDARNLGDYFIRVNVPSYRMDVVYKNKIIKTHDVIVGTNRLDDNKQTLVQGHLNRTKLFTTNLYEVVVNPDWILPVRVEKGELRTKIAQDPRYLEKHNIRRRTLPSGRSVLIQGRGELNVLGRVKFLLKESSAIFLHDTNDRSLFRHQKRDLSHGCVRVKGAVGFAKWLLERDGFDAKGIKRTFRAVNTQRGMKLKKPISLVTEYRTAGISDEGRPIFYYDVYGYDSAYFDKKLPAKETAIWGGPVMRPPWVPRVSEKIVNGWKAAGKAAPRKYDPKTHGG
jgi:murein L,D-transpeptidase YcbB/YkuD